MSPRKRLTEATERIGVIYARYSAHNQKDLKRVPLVTLNLCVLGISVEVMEGWLLMGLTLKLFGRCSK